MTMTDLRGKIERVLEKHDVQLLVKSLVGSLVHPTVRYSLLPKQAESLIDDLLALLSLPEPSREELDEILHRCYLDKAAELRQMLLAWSRSGRKQEPKWCEHLKWMKQTATMAAAHIPEGWVYLQPDNVLLSVPTDAWICCPICAAPRPGEGV